MKVYGVLESELKTLAMFNTLATVGVSVASFFTALAAGVWTNAAFASGPVPPEGAVLTKFGVPVLLGIAAVAVGVAIWAFWNRHETWKEICAQSKPRA